MADYDLAIIGGGITGAAIARDAAGRGLKVLLVERNDLASGASAASAGLVGGGLQALREHAFGPVREALAEREVLLRTAPHLVEPMRFVLPSQGGERADLRWRAELLLYDHMARRRILPRTRTIDLTHHPCGAPLHRRYGSAFEYSDCRVDDARLVVLNAVDAAMRGAEIRTRTRCIRADRSAVWTLVLNSRGRRVVVSARAVVNATGPWLASVSEMVFRHAGAHPIRLAKGSHIVVRSLFDHDRGYALPAPDGRVVFARPFASGLTVIGASEKPFAGDPAAVAPDPDEIVDLCATINRYFRENITASDVVWSFAGVRCVYRGRATTEGRALHDDAMGLDAGRGKAPLLTVYGGRITTHRRLAEAALDRLAGLLPCRRRWTRRAPLPGGEFGYGAFDALLADVRRKWPFLGEENALRLARAYGGRIELVLADAKTWDDLGPCFGAGLTAAEVRYLMRYEWAETPDDVLWRRSKLGLFIGPEGRELIARFMTAELAAGAR